MANKIYFRNAVGKLMWLDIPQAASKTVLDDVNTKQQSLATFISKNLGCAIMLPILAVIK